MCEVNETLSINWEDRAPARAVGRRLDDRRIELRLVRPLRHRLPLQRADGKVDARARGLPHGAAEVGARRHDRHREGRSSRRAGYGAILKVSEAESAMRESRIRRTKTVCTYCGVGCSFDVWTKDRIS